MIERHNGPERFHLSLVGNVQCQQTYPCMRERAHARKNGATAVKLIYTCLLAGSVGLTA